jgi:hypothetical protein
MVVHLAAERQNNRNGQSGAMGDNAKWMAVEITMDGSSKNTMDGGSGNGQRRRNGQRNRKASTMGDGTETAMTATMTQKMAVAAATTTTTADGMGRMATTG